jgi:hypothetical protein
MRALHVLLHGDIPGAIGYNALLVFVLPWLVYGVSVHFAAGLQGRVAQRVGLPRALYSIIPVVIVLFWVLRNLPVFPFTVLAP